MRRIIVFFFLTVLLLSGCTNPETAKQPGIYKENRLADKSVDRIAYLCSDASNLWLQHISDGIKDACNAFGMEFLFIDCKGRDDLFLSFLNDLKDIKISALIVSPTNEGLGPMITSKCNQVGIPLLCIESRLKTTEGKNAAYIGTSAYECGKMAGSELVARTMEKDLLKYDKPLNVVLLSRRNFFYENQMMQGFQDAFRMLLPDLREEEYIELETYHSLFELQYLEIKNQLKALDNNSRYIGVSYNDDGALALYRFACESGIDMDDIFICSKGGYDPAYNIFQRGGKGAENYIAVGVNPFEIGQKAVYSIYSYINNGEELPEMQIVKSTLLTSLNFKEYFQQVYGNKIAADMIK